MNIAPNDAHHAFWDSAQLPGLIDGLVERGWYVGERFLDVTLCEALREELKRLHQREALQEAAIGRGEERTLRRDIRGDAIHWLDRESLAQRRYLALMSELQQQINVALYAGLFEFEAHFAHYPPGAFYRKHYDSFRGRANRIISTVLYLNSAWPADGGGEMALSTNTTPSAKWPEFIPKPAPSPAFSPTAFPTKCCRPGCPASASPAGSAATPRSAAWSIRRASLAAARR